MTASAKACLALLRPKQWAKNVLVYAAPGALGILDEGAVLAKATVLFVATSLLASGLYAWNDIRDRLADAVHPTKSSRPVASGVVPVRVAGLLGAFLIVSGLSVAATVSLEGAGVLAVYGAVTTAYSFGAKRLPVFEMMIVASGFVFRAVVGAVSLEVAMSEWFLLCIMFGSLFVVAGKRFAEFMELGERGPLTRPILGAYTLEFLRVVYVISCAVTLVAYCLWAFQSAELADQGLPLYELSIVPIVAVLVRYVHLLESGHGGAPEEIFFGDRAVQVSVAVWMGVYGSAVYLL